LFIFAFIISVFPSPPPPRDLKIFSFLQGEKIQQRLIQSESFEQEPREEEPERVFEDDVNDVLSVPKKEATKSAKWERTLAQLTFYIADERAEALTADLSHNIVARLKMSRRLGFCANFAAELFMPKIVLTMYSVSSPRFSVSIGNLLEKQQVLSFSDKLKAIQTTSDTRRVSIF
jgi:hypothetical protein